MTRRILVTLDGSKVSESILPYVEMLLGTADANVTLASVEEPDVSMREAGKLAYLEGHADRLRNKGVFVDVALLSGAAVAEIVRFAVESKVDLVAMCTHGRTGLTRLLMGSVAEKVLRQLPIPAWVVHPLNSDDPLPVIRRILVPLDGSHRSASILPHVAGMARALGARVDLVTVTYPSGKNELPREVVSANLRRAQESFEEQGLEVNLSILHGDPAAEILGFSEAHRSDLVALSTHGRTGLDRLFYGSVAESILRNTPLPLLVLRTVAVPMTLHPHPMKSGYRALDIGEQFEKGLSKGPYNRA